MIFELISKLTKAEKRFFKLQSKRIAKSKNYVSLFDTIDSSRKISPKSISAANKNFLYRQIIKSLSLYHQGSTASLELRNSLNKIEILYHKGLYRQSLKLLKQTKKKAQKLEKFAILSEILKWEEMLLIINLAEKESLDQASVLLKEKQENFDKIITIDTYRSLYFKTSIPIRKSGFIRDLNKHIELNQHFNIDYLTSVKRVNSNESSFLFCLNKCIYLIYVESAYQEAHDLIIDFIETLEPQTHFIEENPAIYIDCLYFFGVTCIYLNKKNETLAVCSKMRNLPYQSNEINAEIFARSFTLELELYARSGDFEIGTRLIPKLEEGIRRHQHAFIKLYKALIYFNIAKQYFGIGDYHNALKWLNELLNDKTLYVKDDVYTFSLILHVISHYELGNYDLVQYLTKSVSNTLKSKERFFKTEKSILKFLQSTSYINHDEKINHQQNLKKELIKLSRDFYERKALEDFNYLSWINSKISGKEFAETVKASFIS